MDERRDPERAQLHKLLTSQSRVWGKLNLAQSTLVKLEAELEAAHERLAKADKDVERLERPGFTRLRARLRGRLPDLLEKESREAATALADVETLEQRVDTARKERDRLERHLAKLRSMEAGFGDAAVARAKAQREAAASDPPEDNRRREDELLRLAHDLEDLEEAEEALERAAHLLEEARDALASIEPPSFLAVISGIALLDLFETDAVKEAREALRGAKDAGRTAARALESLEELQPPHSCLEILGELEEHRFLDFLYHEGKIAKVLEKALAASEEFRGRTWDIRARVRSLKDGVLVKLGES